MSKRDRIAVVITLVTLPWFLLMAFETTQPKLAWVFMWCAVGVPYWGYRFIKNDISFLNIREPSE
jgi:hypothetical protein